MYISREADLVPVLAPSLETQCTNNADYILCSSNTVSAPMIPGSSRYHITSNYLFTYGKRDESKMCCRKGSEKKEEGDK